MGQLIGDVGQLGRMLTMSQSESDDWSRKRGNLNNRTHSRVRGWPSPVAVTDTGVERGFRN